MVSNFILKKREAFEVCNRVKIEQIDLKMPQPCCASEGTACGYYSGYN